MYITYLYSHCPFLNNDLISAALLNVIKYKKYTELYFIFPHSIVKVFLRSVFLGFISSCVNLFTDHMLPVIDYCNSQPTLKYPP
jgi:hypothetical protein